MIIHVILNFTKIYSLTTQSSHLISHVPLSATVVPLSDIFIARSRYLWLGSAPKLSFWRKDSFT